MANFTAMDTILLIEDNKDILENLTDYLEMEGYNILFAIDGEEGIELAREFVPDLIISDVLISEKDGHEVLRLLLNTFKTNRIPFIFSTSNPEKVDRDEALELGADDYIVQPFEPEALLLMARKWIKSGSENHTQLIRSMA